MPIITLAIKTYGDHHLKIVDDLLKLKLKGLRVKAQVCGKTVGNWVQVSISGEDENIALRYINKEIGICPSTIEEIKKFSTLKGYITSINKNQIRMDIGVSSPTNIKAAVSIQHLQAQLADGRKLALKKLAELYGFCEYLPLTIKAFTINMEENRVEAIFSETQLKIYKKWMKSLLDRLIILGAAREEVASSLKITKCLRDTVDVEQLGLFENAVTCKLGTNAAGLVPKIGKQLPNTMLTIFSPKKIIEFLGENHLLDSLNLT